MSRYLTKSRFKTGLECPAKLFYAGNEQYADRNLDDAFLAALAEGGYQVGELAKLYYPGGMEVYQTEHHQAVRETMNLLESHPAVFEAAFLHNNLFIRADIVEKKENRITITEVKAKSFDPSSDSFLNKSNEIRPEWRSYLFDIAFQVFVVEKVFPAAKVSARLMLADKSTQASVDGLNQQFVIEREGKRKRVILAEGAHQKEFGNKLLIALDVDAIVHDIHAGLHSEEPFEQMIERFADHYVSQKLIDHPVGSYCAKCEFQALESERQAGIRSGFHECWIRQAGFKEADFAKPSVLSIWDFRKKKEFIQEGRYFMESVSWEDLQPKTKSKKVEAPGLSRVDRQWKQIQLSVPTSQPFLDREGLHAEMAACTYPLHFIDFETTSVAIPFYKGMRPYEQVAFQFSHHILEADGSIRHASQWINASPGYFPNFDFVRALRNSLDGNSGSIFMYHTHENTILNAIYLQLQQSAEPDRNELCSWIQTITKSTSGSAEQWEGERKMIDLRQWVLRYYYSPKTGGSNSIKQVLPALIAESGFLQSKYGQPIYGTDKIFSHNFSNHTWLLNHDGHWQDPYKSLPKVHFDIDESLLDNFMLDEEAGIADGGAAMMAYAKMQFTRMSDEERRAVVAGLLRYCELDTLAMVMLWEGWANWS